MPFKEEDLAYAAGLIDGEGYIGITRLNEVRRTRRTIHYQPQIKVAMTERAGVAVLHELFGGYFYLQRRDRPRKDVWDWSVKGQQVKQVLLPLLPFLRVKRSQAEVVLSFVAEREQNSKTRRWGVTNYVGREAELYADIRRLNARRVTGADCAV